MGTDMSTDENLGRITAKIFYHAKTSDLLRSVHMLNVFNPVRITWLVDVLRRVFTMKKNKITSDNIRTNHVIMNDFTVNRTVNKIKKFTIWKDTHIEWRWNWGKTSGKWNTLAPTKNSAPQLQLGRRTRLRSAGPVTINCPATKSSQCKSSYKSIVAWSGAWLCNWTNLSTRSSIRRSRRSHDCCASAKPQAPAANRLSCEKS